MRRGSPWRAGLGAVVLAAACTGGAGGIPSVEDLLGPSDSSTAAGLKEALRVGTSEAVARNSAPGGYLQNPQIRIPLPDSLQTMATGLRAVGLGAQVDELDVAMNRAAEQAAGEASDVFWQGIQQMTFSDAQAILTGGDHAATDYFERTTRDTLRARFQPIVDAKMNQVGLVQSYDQLVARYTALPFARKPSLDLRGYVTEGALDGLFHVLGEEEKRIRTDPAARTTELLRQVFGSR